MRNHITPIAYIALVALLILTMSLFTACGTKNAETPSDNTITTEESGEKGAASEATSGKDTAGKDSNSNGAAQNKGNQVANGILSSFSAVDLDGNLVDQRILSDYELTMVNVWATYCPPCLGEMPDLGALANEYESNGKGVRIVGMISDATNPDGTIIDGQIDLAQSIVAETGASYLHIVPTNDLSDFINKIVAVPTTYFVDSDGVQVGEKYVGAKSKTEWKEIIDKTLKEAQK